MRKRFGVFPKGVLMLKETKFFSTSRIAVIALFSALSGVLYALLRIPLPFFASWLELNFSDIPALIGTFALGPVSGALIVVFKIIIKLIISNTSTVFVGELADLLVGLAFVVPAGMIYKRRRTMKGAVLSMVVGSVSSIVMAMLANRFILIPFYINVMGWSMDMLVGMLGSIYPSITADNFYLFYIFASVLPFNAMRCVIACLVTLLLYKHISRFIVKMSLRFDSPRRKEVDDGAETDEAAASAKAKSKKRVIITVAVCCVVVALLVAGALLRYFLS